MFVDPLKRYRVPAEWTADHVLTRMRWAFNTLDRIRQRVGPKGFKSSWPAYVYEFADKVAQEEAPAGADHSEAERMRLNSASETRVILPPSARDIDLMEEAFQWPLAHLHGARRPQIAYWARSVTLGRPIDRVNMERVYTEAGMIVSGLIKAKVDIR